MMARSFILAVWALAAHSLVVVAQSQRPLGLESDLQSQPEGYDEERTPKLHGRFLHITDMHPDFYYKAHTDQGGGRSCHRGSGDAGQLGAPGTACDAPLALTNATFTWIDENLRDSIDFVVWTGDSARHDRDEKTPRTEKEILELNQLLVDQFVDIFTDHNAGPGVDMLRVPIIPNIGNNDIMPHNVLKQGPNRWTKRFAGMWDKFIPEGQRHSFVEGGWFSVEVIPNKLAVFSLNTMYFYESNPAVDGCMDKGEPGYQHMEWLRVQLQFIRDRNMKAILTGHVPPARSGSKSNWDETCWQKYTLWLQQYRDVIVGSVYGHMNIDHFMIQDFHHLKIKNDELELGSQSIDYLSDEILSIQSRSDYLVSLREEWSRLPSPPSSLMHSDSAELDAPINPERALALGKQDKMKKYLEEIGGPWAEKYSMSLVSPSVVPNYFPTLRVIEYNITGMENSMVWAEAPTNQVDTLGEDDEDPRSPPHSEKKKKKKKKKKKGKKKPKQPFKVPKPPSSTSPPGPAYSNQPLTWLSYTQYFANLTLLEAELATQRIDPSANWREYRRSRARGAKLSSASPKVRFEVEYDTKDDGIYKLKDMTLNSYLELARRIAKHPQKDSQLAVDSSHDMYSTERREVVSESRRSSTETPEAQKDGDVAAAARLQPATGFRNKVWGVFLRRAFVGYFDDDELIGQISSV
ncbi:hypothetical protein AJ80_03180 [Polytolypa hystricis UAMH7299]|uniref:Endopolyphosphatase n=1 Tax=Polytolypa hystricis (strain UAMH7299) TaxID=1447883 RepID=A0A2B7YKY6_POLH7|nr:hypothetical protein AJ80_03180 [Polytolypa hystricis UAMH7299]